MSEHEKRENEEDPRDSIKRSLSIIFIDSMIGQESLPEPQEFASTFYSYKEMLVSRIGNLSTKALINEWSYQDLFNVVKEEEGLGWRLFEEILVKAKEYNDLEFPNKEK